MQLVIVRHAQSINNSLADQRDRVCDPALTELGERQADILARHLAAGTELEPPASPGAGRDQRGYGITRLYCSPMWRALQTADHIGRVLGLKPEVWTDLHEKGGIFLDEGDGRGPVGYPGKTRGEIQAAFPYFVLPEDITERGWWNREYEDWPTCYKRAIKVAEELGRWAAAEDERIAIVSHVDFLDVLLKALFNQSLDHHIFYYHYNTAISRIDFQSDGRLNIRYLNQVTHLPTELISGNPRRPFA